MSQQTSSKQRDTLNTQSNAEETLNESSTLVEHESIEGTPFTLIKENDKWFLVIGNQRMTEDKNTKEEALELMETHKWELIFGMVISILRVEGMINNIRHEAKIYEKLKNTITEEETVGDRFKSPRDLQKELHKDWRDRNNL